VVGELLCNDSAKLLTLLRRTKRPRHSTTATREHALSGDANREWQAYSVTTTDAGPSNVPKTGGTVDVDLLIIGAGPTGLFAAYYAGFRGFRTAILDSLPEPGGQITAMYPEKLIFDVAGFPSVKGQTLVDDLVAQAGQFNPTYLLEQRAEELERLDDGSLRIHTHKDLEVRAKAVLITGGIGTFSPRSLPGADLFEHRGLRYFVPKLDELAGHDTLIVGGGDSAVDWALSLEPVCKSVTLIHRRDRFRAHEHSVNRMMASSVTVMTPYEVAEIHGDTDGNVAGVTIEDKAGGVQQKVDVQSVVAALGFHADLGPIEKWGLELSKRHILVDTTMATNVPGVFAAGDIVDYTGKVRLIAVGFGEAATAVNNAAPVIDPSLKLFPGHSSDVG
jgi:thioredoxin reductase (NADPH)